MSTASRPNVDVRRANLMSIRCGRRRAAAFLLICTCVSATMPIATVVARSAASSPAVARAATASSTPHATATPTVPPAIQTAAPTPEPTPAVGVAGAESGGQKTQTSTVTTVFRLSEPTQAPVAALHAGSTSVQVSVPAPALPAPTATPEPGPTGAPTPEPTPAPAPPSWSFDIYDSTGERWQDPDYTACTAAATESMLNTIASAGSGSGLVWSPTTSYDTQESILAFERDNMTMLTSSAGTDPHGWRNALNYFGWGSLGADVYRDASYSSFDAAARAAVSAIATTHKPVGILAHAGGHAEFVTGYKVTGDDPGTGSSNFEIVGVYLSDPLRSNGHRDAFITLSQWSAGGSWVRFSPYLETDSPNPDPIDGQVGTTEWYGYWVMIEPVR
jgi:hypothetical protein